MGDWRVYHRSSAIITAATTAIFPSAIPTTGANAVYPIIRLWYDPHRRHPGGWPARPDSQDRRVVTEGYSAVGTVKEKRLPLPGSLRASILPP